MSDPIIGIMVLSMPTYTPCFKIDENAVAFSVFSASIFCSFKIFFVWSAIFCCGKVGFYDLNLLIIPRLHHIPDILELDSDSEFS